MTQQYWQGDLVQAKRKPDRLLLRSYVEGSNGLWFCFTLEGSWWSLYQTLHSNCSVKKFTTPKSTLYLGNCSPKREYPKREGKWALSYWAVATILLRSSVCFISLPCTNFCRGIWYQESPKAWRRLYYMELLAKRFRVTPRRHRGLMTDSLNGRFFFRSSLIILSLKCIVVVLFNNALQQRFREIVYPEHTITNMKQHVSRLL